MLERFTERARHVVVLASEEARGFKHDSIGTEHILLGLIREEEGLAARVLASLDITLERARGEVVRMVGVGQEAVTGQIPLTPSAKQVLEASLREAITLGHNYIGTEHILLGLVSLNDGAAAQILLDLDASPKKIRGETIHALSAAGGIRSRPRPDEPHWPTSRHRGPGKPRPASKSGSGSAPAPESAGCCWSPPGERSTTAAPRSRRATCCWRSRATRRSRPCSRTSASTRPPCSMRSRAGGEPSRRPAR